ncbi:MAG: hypothetical protein HC892_04505 [Saprospiraceae bacterium]|nr:hypothetical protein [Saprospiraceae bacterium]
MPDWTPKDIDHLFKVGSEQYNFEYNPAAWAQMEALLDRDRRKKLIWWWFWGIFISAIILSLGWVAHIFGNNTVFNTTTRIRTEQQTPVIAPLKKAHRIG